MLPMPIVCIPLSPSSIQSGMAKDLAGYGFWCSKHHLLKVIATAFHQSQMSEATYSSGQCQLMSGICGHQTGQDLNGPELP